MLKNSTCGVLQGPIQLPAQQQGYPTTSFLRIFFESSGISKKSRYHSNQKFLKKVEIWLRYEHLKMAIWGSKTKHSRREANLPQQSAHFEKIFSSLNGLYLNALSDKKFFSKMVLFKPV